MKDATNRETINIQLKIFNLFSSSFMFSQIEFIEIEKKPKIDFLCEDAFLHFRKGADNTIIFFKVIELHFS